MIYTDFTSLVQTFYVASTVEDQRKTADLIKLYFDSLNNPPPGVIGVGCITYAQDCLIAAQMNTTVAMESTK